VNSLQNLLQALAVVQGTIKVEELQSMRFGIFHEWVETPLCEDHDLGTKSIPDVAENLTEVLQADWITAIAEVSIQPPISLYIGKTTHFE
jgi:hypothetical protein